MKMRRVQRSSQQGNLRLEGKSAPGYPATASLKLCADAPVGSDEATARRKEAEGPAASEFYVDQAGVGAKPDQLNLRVARDQRSSVHASTSTPAPPPD